jgi:hypothetical protein
MHRKTWYTGHMWYEWLWAYYINCVLWSNVCYTGLWIHWFHDLCATIPNGSVTIGQTLLVGMGHLRSDLILPLMLHTVCCVMAEALVLYYRSLGIVPTPLRMGNISGRPCMGVMSYNNALAFSAIKHLVNYCQFYTISFENPKTY